MSQHRARGVHVRVKLAIIMTMTMYDSVARIQSLKEINVSQDKKFPTTIRLRHGFIWQSFSPRNNVYFFVFAFLVICE